MKIVHVLPKYRHCNWQKDPNTTELSYEYRVTLRALQEYRGGAYNVVPFFHDVVMMKRGKDALNRELLSFIEVEKPQFVFFHVGGAELAGETYQAITDLGIVTLYWTADDSWRFDSVSKKFAPHCSVATTNRSSLVPKYEAMGCRVINTHEGIQGHLYHPIPPGEKNIDVSFVGTWNPERGKTVKALRAAGIPVFVRGKGWPEGEVAKLEELISIMAHSKISLILNPPSFSFGLKPFARFFLKRPEFGSPWRKIGIEPDLQNFRENVLEWWQKRVRQVKGRHFETLACRTLGMTLYAEDLERYYDIQKEIVTYEHIPDLVEKIRYYLAHNDEREAIAQAGYDRTMRDHTIEKRLDLIFTTLEITPRP